MQHEPGQHATDERYERAVPESPVEALDVPVGLIRSAKDTLFTSGTLGRFCTMMESLPEAKTEP